MSTPRIVAALTPGPADSLPLVLGPSLGTTTALWSWARPALAERHRLLSWDLPGHGASPAPTAPFTLEELAAGVLAAADDAGLDRFAVAGVSLGGLTSLSLALLAPERVAAVAMLAALPRMGQPDAWHERAGTVRQQGTPALVGSSAERWFAPGFIAAAPRVAGQLLDELMDVDDEGYARCCEALAAADLGVRLGELRAPLAMLPGSDDPTVAVDAARAVAEAVPEARLTVIDGAGHQPPAERPDAVAGVLTDLLGGIR
jgi:3-oxoadipate enol-lactonase